MPYYPPSSSTGLGNSGQIDRFMFPISQYVTTASSTTMAVGNVAFNPSDVTYNGTTINIYFFTTAYVTNGATTGTIQLYDLTAASSIASISVTATTPTKGVSTVLSLTASEHIYEVRISLASGNGATDQLFCQWAGFRIDQTKN